MVYEWRLPPIFFIKPVGPKLMRLRIWLIRRKWNNKRKLIKIHSFEMISGVPACFHKSKDLSAVHTLSGAGAGETKSYLKKIGDILQLISHYRTTIKPLFKSLFQYSYTTYPRNHLPTSKIFFWIFFKNHLSIIFSKTLPVDLQKVWWDDFQECYEIKLTLGDWIGVLVET